MSSTPATRPDPHTATGPRPGDPRPGDVRPGRTDRPASAPTDPVGVPFQAPRPDVRPDLRTGVTQRLAELLDHPPALALTSSCTHALEASALLLDVGPGDEVIVPAFTFPSTATAFLLRGATIRFADIDPRTGNIDPAAVAAMIGPRTRAVVCVHYGGVAADLGALVDLTDANRSQLVEDAAHGLLGAWDGVPLGRFGTTGCFSFHHTKNLSAGTGGAIAVNDEDLVDRVDHLLDKGTNRAAFDSGAVTAYEWTGLGSAWRMPDAAVEQLAGQLDRLEQVQRRRHNVWDRYAAELAGWAERVGAQLPHVPTGATHPAHLFWILLPPTVERDAFTSWTGGHGVPTIRHFGSLPESAFGRSIADPGDRCPVAHRFAGQLVRLPLHDQLDDPDIDRVLEVVTAWPGRQAVDPPLS